MREWEDMEESGNSLCWCFFEELKKSMRNHFEMDGT
jgi:hypothetical protein